MRPKTVLEDNLTAQEKADLDIVCNTIMEDATLSNLDRANKLSAARKEAQRTHKN